jgi:dTDP-4-amino-4,6-dideoxygalactose transaminase
METSEAIKSLKGKGIDARTPVFRPIHTYFGMEEKLFHNTEEAQRHNLSLPIYPGLNFGSVAKVVGHLADYIEEGK